MLKVDSEQSFILFDNLEFLIAFLTTSVAYVVLRTEELARARRALSSVTNDHLGSTPDPQSQSPA